MLENIKTNTVALFIIPRASTAWRGNEAGWITAAGWAAAGEQKWGKALVMTTDGIFTPQQARLFPRGNTGKQLTVNKLGKWRSLIPEFLITAFKDYRLYKNQPSTWPIDTMNAIAEGAELKFVWERHDLFPGPGYKVAKKLNIPFVISVEAAVVWEAKKWGVQRPIWGRIIEKYVESASLKRADKVVCVSEEVKQQVIKMGVLPNKVMVTPNRVDASLFHPNVAIPSKLVHSIPLNKKIIGWTGSFRKFHGLDSVVKAFNISLQYFPESILLLIGDGLEFTNIKALVSELGINEKVIFTGRIPFNEVPYYLACCSICLVSANSPENFHYSPLKLREYLAMGKPVIAPLAGDLPKLFVDKQEVVFYNAGDEESLSEKMVLLLSDNELKNTLTRNALSYFEKEGTWLHELTKVCESINEKRV